MAVLWIALEIAAAPSTASVESDFASVTLRDRVRRNQPKRPP